MDTLHYLLTPYLAVFTKWIDSEISVSRAPKIMCSFVSTASILTRCTGTCIHTTNWTIWLTVLKMQPEHICMFINVIQLLAWAIPLFSNIFLPLMLHASPSARDAAVIASPNRSNPIYIDTITIITDMCN